MRPMSDIEIDKSTLKGRITSALRKAVIESNKSQTEIALALGCRPENINAMLSGRQNLTLDSVSRILTAIDAEIDFEILFKVAS